MSRESPEEVFAEAQAAMERGDRAGCFVLLHADDLIRIATHALRALLPQEGEAAARLEALCAGHGLPDGTLAAARERWRQLLALAEEVRRLPPTEAAEASRRRARRPRRAAAARPPRRLRDEGAALDAGLKRALKRAKELGLLTAALEEAMRACCGGGAITSSLFVGERLEELVVEGDKAWARRRQGQWDEAVGFVRGRGGWLIKLKARRPR